MTLTLLLCWGMACQTVVVDLGTVSQAACKVLAQPIAADWINKNAQDDEDWHVARADCTEGRGT